MAGQVNANYSANFQKFVDFANKAYATKGEDTVARFKGMPVGDYKGAFASFKRTADMKAANDQVRDLFRKTVAGMFGGEKFIPDIVRDNMKLEDFNKGKPLTARRINLVKIAIDTLGGGKFADPASIGRATARARREHLPAGDGLHKRRGRGRRARPELEGATPLRLRRTLHAECRELQGGPEAD